MSSLVESNTGDEIQDTNDQQQPIQNNGGGAQAQAQAQPNKLESFFAMTKSLIIRALIIYFITSMFRPRQPPTDAANKNLQPGVATPKVRAWNYFENGSVFDLHVWLSDNEYGVDFKNSKNFLWHQEDLIYGDWSSGSKGDGSYERSVTIKTTPQLMNNGSIYLHAFVTKSGESPDPTAPNYVAKSYVCHQTKTLNRFRRLKINRNYNLLASEREKLEMELANAQIKDTIVSHWHPNITVNIVVDQTNWIEGTVPPKLDEYIRFVDGGRTYLPIVYINDFWNLGRDYYPINETTPELPLHITFHPITNFKWQLYATQDVKNKFTSSFSDFMSSGNGEVSLYSSFNKFLIFYINILIVGK